MAYKHGAIGQIVPSTDTLPPNGVATLPVYIGTAPIHLSNSNYDDVINRPVLVSSFEEAQSAVGYSDDWGTFTLCEAIYAHFKNTIGSIGPIVLINVLDPSKHTADKSVSVTFLKGVATVSTKAIASTITIADKVLNTDYKVAYDDNGNVVITDLKGTLSSPLEVTYDEIDISKVTDNDIIGKLDDTTGKRTGLSCVDLIYQEHNMIPTILAAPGWSYKKEIFDALISKAQKVNGHWDLIVNADLNCDTVKTIPDAIKWKDEDGFISKIAKTYWPKDKNGDKIYWLSTMATVRMQQTDFDNDNIPYNSPSNKQIMCTGTVLKDGTPVRFDEQQANQLNAEGITTAVFLCGNWRLWGPHMSNYRYGADVKTEDKFDSSVRMMRWLTNSFQENYMKDVDTPFNRRFVESVLDDCQIWLNSLETEGKLLFAKIDFLETSNSLNDMVEGDFVFDIRTTTTPPAKSLTFKLQYTTAGLNTLFGGE